MSIKIESLDVLKAKEKLVQRATEMAYEPTLEILEMGYSCSPQVIFKGLHRARCRLDL